MDIVLLIKSIIGLVLILGVLIFFLLYSPKKKIEKEKELKQEETKHSKTDMPSLLEVIKNKNSTTEELKEALDLVIKHHGTIHPKLGLRAHPDFDIYGEIIIRLCRHPNTNKNLILDFERALEKKNEDYVRDINEYLEKGLNSIGA